MLEHNDPFRRERPGVWHDVQRCERARERRTVVAEDPA